MNIAITINTNQHSIWSSGINQNGAYLAMLLKRGKHNVDLVSRNIKDNLNFSKEVNSLIGIDLLELDLACKKKYDVVIQLGLYITKQIHQSFLDKNKNLKLVAYKCGNDFITDMEAIIFGNEKREKAFSKRTDDAIPDQIWSIPQMENSNLSYYKFQLNQENATVVPFIWDPIAIETLTKKMSHLNYGTYTKREISRIAIMEPNISIMKNVFHPLISINEAYKRVKISLVLMIGASGIKTNKRLLQILSKMQVFKDKKVKADNRYPTIKIINEHCDMVLSWQWENNLNYLYLDVAWMGWPIVHNAKFCKDVGYYYNEFNSSEASEQIENVIKNHNEDEDYLNRNRKAIKRYTSENINLINQYNELLEDLVNNKFRRRSYDYKTNSVS